MEQPEMNQFINWSDSFYYLREDTEKRLKDGQIY